MRLIFSTPLLVAPRMSQCPIQEVEDDGVFEKVLGEFIDVPFDEIAVQVVSYVSSDLIDITFGGIPS